MRRSRFSPPLIVFAVVFAAIWSAAILVLTVNPLGVFSWGVGPKLDASDYKNMTTYLLIDAVIKDPSIDVVLVGSSTGWRFRRGLMDRYLPAKNAINISYAAALPADRAIVMDRLGRLGHFKRIIMTLDWSYIVQPDEMREGFPGYLYDDGVIDKIRMVDPTTVALAWERLMGEPLRLAHWKTGDEDTEDPTADGGSQNIQSPAGLRRLARQMELHRSEVDLPSGMRCADFATINRQLVPEAKLLASRHIAFDVVIMPLSLATYYSPPRGEFPFMNKELQMRACAVKALDGIPGVRIFAFDNVLGLTDNLANYKNTAHLRKPELFVMMLRAISQGTQRLTRANVDGEMALLRRRILAYKLRDSEIPGFAGDGS
jgi:hypothetical protein